MVGITSNQGAAIANVNDLTKAVLTQAGVNNTRNLSKEDINKILSATPSGVLFHIANNLGVEIKQGVGDTIKLLLNGMLDTSFSTDDAEEVVEKLAKEIDDNNVLQHESLKTMKSNSRFIAALLGLPPQATQGSTGYLGE
jgi:hypothetical protein